MDEKHFVLLHLNEFISLAPTIGKYKNYDLMLTAANEYSKIIAKFFKIILLTDKTHYIRNSFLNSTFPTLQLRPNRKSLHPLGTFTL